MVRVQRIGKFSLGVKAESIAEVVFEFAIKG